jgi:hypothetical protein
MAHEEDRDARRTHDTFGVAAHYQSRDAAAAVSPEHDEIGAAPSLEGHLDPEQ